ncbi:MAG: glycosyltransferase family 2 protein [Bacteroidetes bacterium]|nr:glycosyltransferase family 2 protein [Bacteroidota bacterium]
MKVAVVILNWNGETFLRQFLPTVIEHSAGAAEVIIADNASMDGSVAYIRNTFPALRIIQHNSNKGFAAGYNLALQQIEADYFILLNSDIEVTPNWIPPVIELMEKDPSVGACQPKLRSCHDRKKFEYAGAAGGFIDKYGYPFCRGRVFQHMEEDTGQYDDEAEIFWATGACMFVRADLYNKLGGLDDDFFAHMEEIDFCWRLKNEGYRIMYCSKSTVYHVGGGTLPKSSYKKTYLNFRNNFMLLYKNLPANRFFPVFSTRLLLDGVAAFKFLMEGHFRDFFAVSRAHLSFYKRLTFLKIKRSTTSQHPAKQVYQKNIVIDHFLRRKNRFSDLDSSDFSK